MGYREVGTSGMSSLMKAWHQPKRDIPASVARTLGEASIPLLFPSTIIIANQTLAKQTFETFNSSSDCILKNLRHDSVCLYFQASNNISSIASSIFMKLDSSENTLQRAAARPL